MPPSDHREEEHRVFSREVVAQADRADRLLIFPELTWHAAEPTDPEPGASYLRENDDHSFTVRTWTGSRWIDHKAATRVANDLVALPDEIKAIIWPKGDR